MSRQMIRMRVPSGQVPPMPMQQDGVYHAGFQPYNMHLYEGGNAQMPLYADDSLMQTMPYQLPYGQQMPSSYMQQSGYQPNYGPYGQNPYPSAQTDMYSQPFPQQPMAVNQAYSPSNPSFNGVTPFSQPFPMATANKKGLSPFANPLQQKGPQPSYNGIPHPYPKQASIQKEQPSGFKSIMNQFKTQDGSIDVTKMMNTAGQMMGTVNQVQSMFKGIGGIFKTTGGSV
ncbi:YppG family protein [Bacillus testis]|uniref:YppG family protein n=1 Tax=Bacillus testis TaxID=1622072 RepID=UPI00067EF139|nr:YppG family protein [Bacillus testis]